MGKQKKCEETTEAVCNSTYGNLLLSDQVPELEIWKKSIVMPATVTISVFNSAKSTTSLRVLVIQNLGSPVEFTVPPGKTLASTVEDAKSIFVFRIEQGRSKGKFRLDVCFPICSDISQQYCETGPSFHKEASSHDIRSDSLLNILNSLLDDK